MTTQDGVPPGWVRDSDVLYLHVTGARIERRHYRQVEGWVLVPVELDRAVFRFSTDDSGREAAFAAFSAGAVAAPAETVSRRVREARDAARLEESDEDARDEKEDAEDEDEEGEAT